MGKHLFQSLPLFLALFLLTACGQDAQAEDPKWQDCRQLYATVLTNSGEDESTARYLSIAQRSQALLPLLEEKAASTPWRPPTAGTCSPSWFSPMTP